MLIVLLIIILFIPGTALAQPPVQYKIVVSIQGGMQKGKAMLRYWGENGPYIDSLAFNNGKFIMTGPMPAGQRIARLSIMNENETRASAMNTCEVWLEPGTIAISAEKNLFTASYNGSEAQKQYSELQRNMRPVIKRNFQLDKAYEKAEAEKDAGTKDYLLNTDYPDLFKEKQSILGAFIRKYPASLISVYKFEDFVGESPVDLRVVEPVYALLPESSKQHPRVKKVAQLIAIAKLTAVGMKAIDFSQADTSGKLVSLSSFMGKYVLIDFWAGWCIPCRAENPHLVKLYEQYKNKGFEIIGVSLDGERKRWTEAIIADSLAWVQVSDLMIFDNAVAKLYGINSIPQNILIDPDAKIIAHNLRGSVLDKKMYELFK